MNERDINRRRFLQRSSATIAAGALIAAHAPSAGSAAEDKTTTDKATADRLIAGKDPRLIVHVTEPPEIETPLSLLREARITPASLLFVRSNQPMPGADTLKPAPGDNWRIEIAGLREGPAKIALADVAKLPQVEVEMVLQCSGNGRAYFSAAAPAKGAQWQAGAMGNVRFGGVPLAKVLEHFQIEPQEAAKFLTAEGRDAPGKPGEADFEHSIPLDDALARSLLAL
jgi:DMSO/TMAO reductase YedYZ molybdopterin-dependent catalytic subunit